MGEVVEQGDRFVRMSIARLAEEFGMARETVSKRLSQASVRSDGERSGHPVYRLRDACPALLTGYSSEDGAGSDPAKLRPSDRRAWYQSENERLKFEVETGQLILATEVQGEMAAMAKMVVRFLDTLPDHVERDLRCGPDTVEYLIRKTREVRAGIADALLNEEADGARLSA